jgi:hypothetical protein
MFKGSLYSDKYDILVKANSQPSFQPTHSGTYEAISQLKAFTSNTARMA